MCNKHFEMRAKQRSIPLVVQNWLSHFGEEAYDHRGAMVFYFSKRSKRLLEKHLGRHFIQQNQKYLNAYMVTSTDGELITTGWRTKRILNHS